jgi:TonB family protein
LAANGVGGASATPAKAMVESAPAAESAASSEAATVSLTTNPDGADVYVDAQFNGNSPATLKLKPGKHTIRVSMTGYSDWTRDISTDSGSSVNLKATLYTSQVLDAPFQFLYILCSFSLNVVRTTKTHMRCILPVLLLSIALHATDKEAAYQSRLHSALAGRTIMFLAPYPGSSLHFSANGELKSKAVPESWLTNSLFTVHNLKLKPNELRLEGERALMLYESEQHSMVAVPSGRKLEVAIDIDSSQPPDSQVPLEMRKVFYSSNVQDFLSTYWKPAVPDQANANQWREAHPGEPAGVLGSRPVYFVQKGVVETPKPVKTPDPKYDEGARQNRYQGTVVLFLIINEHGDPELLSVARQLGQGLDLSALDTVSRWKFKPAIRQGKPVPVAINVEVNFRLY